MVLVAETSEPSYRLGQRAHSLLWDTRTAADVLVWTTERFDSRLHLQASLPATIVRDGRLLHAARPTPLAYSREWLVKARDDLRAAEGRLAALERNSH